MGTKILSFRSPGLTMTETLIEALHPKPASNPSPVPEPLASDPSLHFTCSVRTMPSKAGRIDPKSLSGEMKTI